MVRIFDSRHEYSNQACILKVAKIENDEIEPTEVICITQAHGPQTTDHDYSSIKQALRNKLGIQLKHYMWCCGAAKHQEDADSCLKRYGRGIILLSTC